MALTNKATLQTAAPSAAAKGKKTVNGGTSNIELHPNPNVVLQLYMEEHSFPTTILEETANEHKSRLPAEG